MKKKISVVGIVLVVFVGMWFALSLRDAGFEEKRYKDVAYLIDGRSVLLVDGFSEGDSSLDSAAKVTTRYFGNEFKTDLNNDGKEDVVFLLTQDMGGTGVFYYVVAALKTDRGYVGSQDAYFLGDRIAPQSTSLSENPRHRNVFVVNYADRAPGQSFVEEPRVGKSVWLKLDPVSLRFGIVEPNFEGESR